MKIASVALAILSLGVFIGGIASGNVPIAIIGVIASFVTISTAVAILAKF